MIDSVMIRLFFVGAIILYLAGFIIPLIYIKKEGKDPHGTHKGSSVLTRLSSVSIMLWLIYIIIYLIFGEIIRDFLALSFLFSDGTVITGMIIIIIAFIIEGLGTIELGGNFRIELPKEKTQLKTGGIYRLMRNPIVFGIYLLLLGSFLLIPTVFSLIFLIFNIITFNSKAKDEEIFLSKRFGKDYEMYKMKVGRYLPFNFKR